MANDSLNFGMGSRRPKKHRPAEGKSVEPSPVVDRWDGIPYPIGSIVTVPSGDKARVIAIRDDGGTRVCEVIEGDALGSRGVYQPRQLGMLEHPGPRPVKRPDPTPPKPIALNLPGPNDPRLLERFPDPDDREAYLEHRSKGLDERFGPGNWTIAEAPTIVQGDFSPDQFDHLLPHRGSAKVLPVQLDGGPADGQVVKLPRRAKMHFLPAAAPDGSGYAPARYLWTDRRTPEDLRIFAFDGYGYHRDPDPDLEPVAAAAG